MIPGGIMRISLLVTVLLLLAAVPAGADGWAILDHDIAATVDPATCGLEVTDRFRLAPPPDPEAPLHLLLQKNLAVSSARAGGAGLDVVESERFQPRHFWSRPDYAHMENYAAAREITLSPPPGGWPGDPVIELTYAGAVYDSLKPPEVAYGRGFETTTGLIGDRGAFLSGPTFWIPWTSEDLFRYTLTATVPKGWESVSQGAWAERRENGGQVVSRWVVDNPMSEAYLIAGPYTVRESAHGDVKLYTFTYADTPDDLCRTYLDAAGEYLDRYDGLIGPYPFTKFAMVENWWQTGFGMPSFTFLGDRVIRLPFIVHTSYGHEILHNWWGNGVFVDYAHGNWCEGLTTYLADYAYKEDESAAAARDYRLGQLQGYLDYAGSGGRDFPLSKFTERESPATQAVGYGKTMMVFHMTRRLLGDDLFAAGLRRFYADNLFREASWADIDRAFEAVSGRVLGRWFDQWTERTGAPTLTLAGVERGSDGFRVLVQQDDPPYALQVPVVYAVSGETRTKIVTLSGASATVTIDPGASWVAVDPDFEVFRRLHREEVSPALSEILGADSTVVVIGSRCAPDVAEALRALAAEWGRNHDQTIVEEAAFTSGGRGVWLFGDGDLAAGLFRDAGEFGSLPQDLYAQAGGRSLVACFRDAEGRPWTALLPENAAVVPALGRKLPHYGSYSYLAFTGEDNTDKGRWVVTSSPLRRDLTGE